MKKIREWLSDKPNPQKHAESLLMQLVYSEDTQYQIEVFERLKARFDDVLEQRRYEAQKETKTINEYMPKSIFVNDPIFEQPIKK